MFRSRRTCIIFMASLILIVGAACVPGGDKAPEKAAPVSFPLEEATIAGLQEMMTSGTATSESLVSLYLKRIEEIDRGGPGLNAIIETNPDALVIARELDRERKEKGPRGPLHGIPVVIRTTSTRPTAWRRRPARSPSSGRSPRATRSSPGA
jgi:amidase